jgi:phage terminase large subunit-like protein
VEDLSFLAALGRSVPTPFASQSRSWVLGCDREECDGRPHDDILVDHARPAQRAPKGHWRTWLILAGRGWGKLLSLDTPLPTPTGWTTMGAVAVGDVLFDEAGRPATVTGVSDTRWEPSWRVSFSDGSSLLAHGEHEWVTWTHTERKALLRSPYEAPHVFPENWPAWRVRRRIGHDLPAERVHEAIALHATGLSAREVGRRLGLSRQALAPHLAAKAHIARQARVYPDSPGPQVRTTDEIRRTLLPGKRGDLNHAIPATAPLQLPDVALPIEPYLLGCWLGDGDSARGVITGADADLAQIERELAGETTHRMRVPDWKAPRLRIDGLTRRLGELGVLRNKHIPAIYLRGSVTQRLSILQGLMDTDGGSDAPNYASFTNTSERLADGVFELAASLGMVPRRDKRPAMLNGVECGVAYRVKFTPTMGVFRLARKAATLLPTPGAQGLRRRHRMITAITAGPTIPMRCLSVDSPHSLYLAGTSMIPTHNTASGAGWTAEQARILPGTQWAAAAKTYRELMSVIVEGPSGLLSHLDRAEIAQVRMGADRPYIRLTNTSRIHLVSADNPDSFIGLNLNGAWGDEFAAWPDDLAYTRGLVPAVRHEPAQIVLTTTPRPVPLVIKLVDRAKTDPDSVRITKGSTWDNAHLSPFAREAMRTEYEGTRLGRQELSGELLLDSPGALWSWETFDHPDFRARAPELTTVVVGIDPAVSSGETSDETGIIVAGRGIDGHGYILADLSCRVAPHDWARIAVRAYHDYGADRVVAEVNNGGDMIPTLIRAIDPKVPVRTVHASRGKRVRAEPVAALYERTRVHHVEVFEELEAQMCAWSPDASRRSPDRMDAMVWALTSLNLVSSPGMAYLSALLADAG